MWAPMRTSGRWALLGAVAVLCASALVPLAPPVRAGAAAPQTGTAGTAGSAPQADMSAAPRDVLGPDPLRALADSARTGDIRRPRIVPVRPGTIPDGPGLKRALQLTVASPPTSPYADGEREIRMAARTAVPLRDGHAVVVRFWGRSLRAADAHARFNVEQAGGDRRKLVSVALEFGPEWREYEYPFRVAGSYPAGAAQASFWLGHGPQTLQIAGFSLRDLGPGDPPGFPSSTYEGRGEDATWRAEARARIDTYRKGNLEVRVRDAAGRPVRGAEVEVAMRAHAFRFGTAVDAATLGSHAQYQQVLRSTFNHGTLGNDLKWSAWENTRHRRQATLPALDWMRTAGMTTTGHALLWPGWRRMPEDVRKLRDRPALLRERVNRHIGDEVGALRGTIDVWDVLNEPYAMHDLQDVLGPDEVASWFRLADRADPSARLFVNDYDILDDHGWNRRHQDYLFTLVEKLRDEDAPVEGVGFQAHFATPQLTPPADLVPILDRYARLGVPLEVSEFDVTTTDEALQADYTRDFLTVAFSHPAVTRITTWGFWEPIHWSPSAAMYRADFTPKPNAAAWRNLIYHDWWTRAGGRTNGGGAYTTRGFLGDYDVSVKVGQAVERRRVSMPSRAGTLVTVVVDPPATSPPDTRGTSGGGWWPWPDVRSAGSVRAALLLAPPVALAVAVAAMAYARKHGRRRVT
ncbi:endo-1,4-beta-xylanase [Actinopolymorpha sp. B17G11]|uniref:endo-1,4-beta-xylanase n=1 Tax=Actinopolymorpha sp. B17G11 TaxID=3160861 RepID=UPI0032E51D52